VTARPEACARAPVYRNLDSPSALLGLAFPAEWLAVLTTGWAGTAAGAPNIGAAVALGTYLALRIAGHGRPEGFLRHALLWSARQVLGGGWHSAAARAPAPRFPFGRERRRRALPPP